MLQQLIRISRHRSEAYKYQHDHRKLYEPKGVLADLDRLDAVASAAAARGGARDPFAASNALKRMAAPQVGTPPPEEDEPMSGTLRSPHRVVQ